MHRFNDFRIGAFEEVGIDLRKVANGVRRDAKSAGERAETDEEFLGLLQAWCGRLKPLVEPAREREAWRRLLAEFTS